MRYVILSKNSSRDLNVTTTHWHIIVHMKSCMMYEEEKQIDNDPFLYLWEAICL